MNKPRKNAALIRAWADGAEIEYWNTYATVPHWVDVVDNKPEWDDGTEYRIKPEKEYPKSSLTTEELDEIWHASPNNRYAVLVNIANAAVKRYIKENEE